MKKFLLVSPLILAACGAEDAVKQAPQETSLTEQADEPAAPASPNASILAVRELPACDALSNGQMVYVVPTGEFKICDATTGDWLIVSIKGEQGDDGLDGKNGKDGVNGVNGVDGAQGPQGVQGVQGEDGQTASNNMWYDPVADKWWLKGNGAVTNWVDATTSICTGAWQVPSIAEYHDAMIRGLCYTGTACYSVWARDESGSDAALYAAGNTPSFTTWVPKTDQNRVYCVER